MEKIELKAKKRDIIGKKVKQLREKGQIPAVMYGSQEEALNLTLDKLEFEHVFEKAGSSSLVDLKIDDKEAVKVLIHEPQLHPVLDQPLHVDLYKVKMTKKISTEIPLEFIGESIAVKDLEGNLLTNKDTVEVECLPGDLIQKIDVDISVLKTFEDLIHVKDLVVPKEIEILDDPEEIVAQVTPPRSEEELKEMEKEAAADAEKAGIEKMEATAEAEKAEKETEKAAEEGAESPAPNANAEKSAEENK
ncbi:hypothetical protein A3F08_00435 [Candidatus Berkelbacteria bacterium RIFCSPHIGHO2_12_FULL_36_9]|uniref:Large ribosomal subunit protein bL25 n=1 Tax=Candidatus Berkelbacteria bacterium RIFCSPHIGHO2_12_FULL_36_9 TaxID=1797469 RepID=A0A1F5EKL0_9BACT|nr:MAG: hypothetical protein A3F08_00435 [Candidatus Berkelbacteria bacterium RIFCSPHIGHO2_12_FULL_36_9]